MTHFLHFVFVFIWSKILIIDKYKMKLFMNSESVSKLQLNAFFFKCLSSQQ